MNQLFSKLKNKYPLAALGLVIVAYLLGKPIIMDEPSDTPVNAPITISEPVPFESSAEEISIDYTFRSKEQLYDHYEKHGVEMGFDSAEEYLAAANRVIASENALKKLEAEDHDFIFYLEASNEFVIVSQDGYIRTYFLPSDGIEYYNRQ